MVSDDFIRRFTEVVKSPAPDLAPAAFMIARLEYPQLDMSHYLGELDRMGEEATARVAALGDKAGPMRHVTEISDYLFKVQGFAGNRTHYDDPRNSFLNDVIDRRTGIPITLALVYIEVSRRAGVRIDGVNFPGHFLLKAPARPKASGGSGTPVIVDPFHGGTILSEVDCESLLHKYSGSDAAFDQRLLARATKQEILVRMLVNLKRLYVGMRSFPQAHAITRLLLGIDPAATTELRDRGCSPITCTTTRRRCAIWRRTSVSCRGPRRPRAIRTTRTTSRTRTASRPRSGSMSRCSAAASPASTNRHVATSHRCRILRAGVRGRHRARTGGR